MPCLTQALTRQPVGAVGSGEAERISPDSRAARRDWKAVMAEGVADGGWTFGKVALYGLSEELQVKDR
jgi:hypothetical protein